MTMNLSLPSATLLPVLTVWVSFKQSSDPASTSHRLRLLSAGLEGPEWTSVCACCAVVRECEQALASLPVHFSDSSCGHCTWCNHLVSQRQKRIFLEVGLNWTLDSTARCNEGPSKKEWETPLTKESQIIGMSLSLLTLQHFFTRILTAPLL